MTETDRSIFGLVPYSTYPSIGLAVLASLPYFTALHPSLAIDATFGSWVYGISLALLAIGVFMAAAFDGKAKAKRDDVLLGNSETLINEFRELRAQLIAAHVPVDSPPIKAIDEAIIDITKRFRVSGFGHVTPSSTLGVQHISQAEAERIQKNWEMIAAAKREFAEGTSEREDQEQ